MDAIDDEATRVAIELGDRMRVGRKLGRTLYLHPHDDDPAIGPGICVGIVDTEALAAEITRRWNAGQPHIPEEQRALDAYDRAVAVAGEVQP